VYKLETLAKLNMANRLLDVLVGRLTRVDHHAIDELNL
jgi:hypothetical protein